MFDETNILPFLGFPYQNYILNSRYPLSNGSTVFAKNIKMIDDRNPEYGIVLFYIQNRMNGSKDLLTALTFNFTKDWYVGRFRRQKASKILKEMCVYNILKKVNDNKQDWSYYVNPIIMHTLTGAQCREMYEQHYYMFNPKPEGMP